MCTLCAFIDTTIFHLFIITSQMIISDKQIHGDYLMLYSVLGMSDLKVGELHVDSPVPRRQGCEVFQGHRHSKTGISEGQLRVSSPWNPSPERPSMFGLHNGTLLHLASISHLCRPVHIPEEIIEYHKRIWALIRYHYGPTYRAIVNSITYILIYGSNRVIVHIN